TRKGRKIFRTSPTPAVGCVRRDRVFHETNSRQNVRECFTPGNVHRTRVITDRRERVRRRCQAPVVFLDFPPLVALPRGVSTRQWGRLGSSDKKGVIVVRCVVCVLFVALTFPAFSRPAAALDDS